MQKYFDLEEESACFIKDTSLLKINRNKYVVTDAAAYIGKILHNPIPDWSIRTIYWQVKI